MGLDINIYSLSSKKWNATYYNYKNFYFDIETDKIYDKIICSWRKWFGLCSVLIGRLCTRAGVKENKYDFVYRVEKKDVKFFKRQVKDLSSPIYDNNIWTGLAKKSKKKYRKYFLQDIKKMKKELKKGKALYIEVSY